MPPRRRQVQANGIVTNGWYGRNPHFCLDFSLSVPIRSLAWLTFITLDFDPYITSHVRSDEAKANRKQTDARAFSHQG